ncbi:MAG: hypothetical protein HZB51_26735 [Chloroflexi bacterium]|nr:hypothetical protein [Chloroflexota bacterium]
MNDIKIEEKLTPEQKKKTYEQPAIIYRAPLEATAGACSTNPPGKATAGCSVTSS